jgi:aminoglycoside 3-N-acetyltransferase
MSLKDLIRSATPDFLLNLNRKRKKTNRNNLLKNQNKLGNAVTVQQITENLKAIGIKEGDTLLVHSALSRIGYLENGPQTFIDALLQVIGKEGNLLMPTSPNNVYQLNYIQNTPFFDVLNSPSKTGAITECFRKMDGVVRSLHPTEPVSAIGPLAEYFTKDHFNQLTPYNENSPFYKVGEKHGKILYVGVTLSMAGTSLHTLEDAVEDFKFPVYYPNIFDFEVIDDKGVSHKVKTKVHDPEWSKQRKCDDLIPRFEAEGVLQKVKIGQADTLLVDANDFLNSMVNSYKKEGVTMYTPKGS